MRGPSFCPTGMEGPRYSADMVKVSWWIGWSSDRVKRLEVGKSSPGVTSSLFLTPTEFSLI